MACQTQRTVLHIPGGSLAAGRHPALLSRGPAPVPPAGPPTLVGHALDTPPARPEPEPKPSHRGLRRDPFTRALRAPAWPISPAKGRAWATGEIGKVAAFYRDRLRVTLLALIASLSAASCSCGLAAGLDGWASSTGCSCFRLAVALAWRRGMTAGASPASSGRGGRRCGPCSSRWRAKPAVT